MTQSTNVQSLRPERPGPAVALLAVAQWLMVLPASLLLAAAALRLLQPRQYQPARASWAIFDWARAHISRHDAAALFVALPVFVILAGLAVLSREWRRDPALRQDAATACAILRRQAATGSLIAATALAAGILASVVIHIVTD
jgi:hypothetical protein